MQNPTRLFSATVTFSKSTESHARTVIHGKMADKGYDLADIQLAINWCEKNKRTYELFDLKALSETDREGWVLVIRNVLPATRKVIHREFVEKIYQKLDRKFANCMIIRTKYARGNAEIGDQYVASDLVNLKIGTRIQKKVSGIVLPYQNLPALNQVRKILPIILGKKATDLLAEVNYYGPPFGLNDYGPPSGLNNPLKKMAMSNCGIGFHGDGERPDVVALVLGEKKELHFQGYRGIFPEGQRVVIKVGGGDLYIMDEVACGHKWARERMVKTLIHFRHAAGPLGGNKYTPSNEKITKTAMAKRKRQQRKKNERKKKNKTTSSSITLN